MTGDLYEAVVYNAYGIRPAVTLKQGTIFSDGDGTATDPYIVQ